MNKNKAKGTRLENRVVAVARKEGFQARKQPLSGQLKDFPEDCIVGDVLLQCKAGYTSQKSFSFQRPWLDAVRSSAEQFGYRMGAVVIRPDSTNKLSIVLDYSDFLKLLQEGSSDQPQTTG